MLLVRKTGDWPAFGWRNPLEELERMKRQMDWLSTSLLRGPSAEVAVGVFPAMNVTEDEETFFVRAELPGMKADELDISVTGDTLAISGERNLPVEDEKAQYHRRERDAGKFSRIVSLPAQVDVDKVKANSNDGVLTVTLPKAETAKPKRIAVKLS